jgi:hypothetical protein
MPYEISDSGYSTGSAGLIQMISLFGRGKIVAAVLSLIATIGWAIQGLGNAFYYRSVRAFYLSRVPGFNAEMRLT